MSRAYRRGADFERQVARLLEGRGCVALRVAGSHGPPDLVALDFRHDEVKLVECKTGGKISRRERKELMDLQCWVSNARAYLASKPERGRIRIEPIGEPV